MSLPILTFHDFGTPRSVLDFSPGVLRAGLSRLVGRGYRTISLLEAVRAWRSGVPLPERRFVITIDDGYANVYTVAYPILEELGLSATLYVTTGRTPSRDRSERMPSLNGRSMLSWRELGELADAGFAIGGHTLTHPDLTRVSDATARDEIVTGKAILEDRLGVDVASFAYPFGRLNRTVRETAAREYECACSDTLGLAGTGSDPYALERIEMYYFDDVRLFRTIGSPLGAAYLAARALPRRARRAWSASRDRRLFATERSYMDDETA